MRKQIIWFLIALRFIFYAKFGDNQSAVPFHTGNIQLKEVSWRIRLQPLEISLKRNNHSLTYTYRHLLKTNISDGTPWYPITRSSSFDSGHAKGHNIIIRVQVMNRVLLAMMSPRRLHTALKVIPACKHICLRIVTSACPSRTHQLRYLNPHKKIS